MGANVLNLRLPGTLTQLAQSIKFRFFIEEVVSPCISFIRLELFKEGAIATDFSKLFERVDLHLAV